MESPQDFVQIYTCILPRFTLVFSPDFVQIYTGIFSRFCPELHWHFLQILSRFTLVFSPDFVQIYTGIFSRFCPDWHWKFHQIFYSFTLELTPRSGSNGHSEHIKLKVYPLWAISSRYAPGPGSDSLQICTRIWSPKTGESCRKQ